MVKYSEYPINSDFMHPPKVIKAFLGLTLSFTFSGCANTIEATQEDVQSYFENHKVGTSPDYAIMKNGTDYLATIHGFMNDQSACLSIIEKYNNDSKLSVLPGPYSCVPLNN